MVGTSVGVGEPNTSANVIARRDQCKCREPCDCRYPCIERVCRSVGTLLCCDSGHSSKWLSMENVIFWVRLNSNMFDISLGRNAQWEHLFSMYLDDFSTICLIFYAESLFSMVKVIFDGKYILY